MGNMRRRNQGDARPYRRACLIMGAAVGVTGVTFGVFADAAGLDLPRIVAMSALMFTGASQFAAVGVISDGGTGTAAIGPALLLAARNTLYGPVVRRVLPDSTLVRLGAAHFVVDETTAMAAAQAERRDATGAFWLTAATLWLCWNLGSIAGAMLGPVMGTAEVWGLDAAFPAIFVAMVATHLRSAAGRIAAAAAAAIALGAVPFSAPGIPILLSVLALPIALYVGTRRERSAGHGNGSEASP
ncbi:MAG: AzlC family ABC transporter permease [bacterium]|nr:AzlC family ABC transporter permease [bacterium]